MYWKKDGVFLFLKNPHFNALIVADVTAVWIKHFFTCLFHPIILLDDSMASVSENVLYFVCLFTFIRA